MNKIYNILYQKLISYFRVYIQNCITITMERNVKHMKILNSINAINFVYCIKLVLVV